MNYADRQYMELLSDVMENGVSKDDRTGTGTIAVFDRTMRFDLSKTFPILTTKRVHFKSVVHELLWFLKGQGNIAYLKKNGITIWDEWADESGELGPVYGVQWRNWGQKISFGPDAFCGGPVKTEGIDQIKDVVDQLKTNPNSRRLVVSAWNVGELSSMALPPCHFAFIFNVMGGKLNCSLVQRSCDLFLGVPFNISSYSLLTCMVSHVVGIPPGEFVWHGIDVHIYRNHFKQVEEQLTRTGFPLPTLILNPGIENIDDFEYDDITLSGYESHPSIKAPISV